MPITYFEPKGEQGSTIFFVFPQTKLTEGRAN